MKAMLGEVKYGLRAIDIQGIGSQRKIYFYTDLENSDFSEDSATEIMQLVNSYLKIGNLTLEHAFERIPFNFPLPALVRPVFKRAESKI